MVTEGSTLEDVLGPTPTDRRHNLTVNYSYLDSGSNAPGALAPRQLQGVRRDEAHQRHGRHVPLAPIRRIVALLLRSMPSAGPLTTVTVIAVSYRERRSTPASVSMSIRRIPTR